MSGCSSQCQCQLRGSSKFHSHSKLQRKRIHSSSRSSENRSWIRADLIVDGDIPLYYGVGRECVENIGCRQPVESRALEASLETEIEIGSRLIFPITARLEQDRLSLDSSEKLVIEEGARSAGSKAESRRDLEYRREEIPE